MLLIFGLLFLFYSFVVYYSLLLSSLWFHSPLSSPSFSLLTNHDEESLSW